MAATLQDSSYRGSHLKQRVLLALAPLVLLLGVSPVMAGSYADLISLFDEWREVEQPLLVDGAPDYRPAAVQSRHRAMLALREKLLAMDTADWSVEEQIDWHLLRAEMNGLDFYVRVLKPWERDPSYYASVRSSQSDTPAEEAPTIHNALRLWKYSIWPRTSLSVPSRLSLDAERDLARELRGVAPLLDQARSNLTGNGRDLWVPSQISFRNQEQTLTTLGERLAGADDELLAAQREALDATTRFRQWLEQEAPKKTGPSGISRQEYTWHLRNVLLVNSTWEGEVQLMQREMARGYAGLRMEEAHNRDLPPLEPVANAEAFAKLQAQSISRYMQFFADHDILTVEPWMDHALRERVFSYSPPETRNFFHQATHRDPRTLWTHFYHYWDLTRLDEEPHISPLRRSALLYNIWMSRAEGVATGMEEWMMNAGLYDDSPRSREIVWIMLITRAARGLSSLYAHDNRISLEEAADMHVKWTPRGWMNRNLDLLGFEQHLYLRQPAYGSSYITGARMMESIIADRSEQDGADFSLREVFDDINAAGLIPVSLLRWAVSGNDEDIRAIMAQPNG